MKRHIHATVVTRYAHNLKHHERIHTGKKLYSCKFCDKKFTQSNTLKAHGTIHTGEKPYSCKFCDKKFIHPSTLKKHEIIYNHKI